MEGGGGREEVRDGGKEGRREGGGGNQEERNQSAQNREGKSPQPVQKETVETQNLKEQKIRSCARLKAAGLKLSSGKEG